MADQDNIGTIITPSAPASMPPVPTPTPPTSTAIPIQVLDQSTPSEPAPMFSATAQPASPPEPIAPPAPPTPEPIAPPVPPAPEPGSTPEPTTPPPEIPIATLPVAPKEPLAPPAPEFGQLQPKIDAHPLFSGAKSPPPKGSSGKTRWLWAGGSLLALIIIAYLAVDSGLVRGASHLPFHVFKQDVAVTAPSIPAPAKTTTTTTDPYAGWKTYTNDEYGFSFRYPTTWSLTTDLKDLGRGHPEGDVIATSPSGTKVHFGPNLGGKGGDCVDPTTNTHTTKTCSTQTVISVEKLPSSSDSKPVYFYTMNLIAPTNAGGATTYYVDIESGESVPTKTGSTLGVFLYPYDEISDTKVGDVTIYVEGSDDSKNNSTAFFDTAEVKEASPVLQSFQLLQ